MYLNGEEKSSAKIFEVKFEPRTTEATHIGEIISDGKERIQIACADGVIHILSMQIAGKKRMSNKDLLLGFRDIEDYSCM